MRSRRIAVPTLLALGLLAAAAGAVRAQVAAGVQIGPSGGVSVDVDFFHSNLAPYGRWVDQPAYGQVFVPRGVPHALRIAAL